MQVVCKITTINKYPIESCTQTAIPRLTNFVHDSVIMFCGLRKIWVIEFCPLGVVRSHHPLWKRKKETNIDLNINVNMSLLATTSKCLRGHSHIQIESAFWKGIKGSKFHPNVLIFDLVVGFELKYHICEIFLKGFWDEIFGLWNIMKFRRFGISSIFVPPTIWFRRLEVLTVGGDIFL